MTPVWSEDERPGTQQIYLDNNATTKPLPQVVEAVTCAMEDGYGNPSSIHGAGDRGRKYLRRAREQVAATLRARVDDVVFMSGATEANNLVLQSLLIDRFTLRRLVTTSVEHSSVLGAAEHLRGKGVEVVILAVDENGVIDRDAMLDAIEPGGTLVSIQWANHETGVLQAIPELATAAHAAGALFHTDAVQAVGKVPITLEESPIDFLSVSGHTIHGPLGIGALVGPGIHLLQPLAFGDSQEKTLRPGTENVPGIVGLGLAMEIRSLRFDAVALETRELRDHFEAQLAQRGLVAAFNGAAAPRLPNTSSVRFAGIDGEALTIRLDQAGIRCSQGAAGTDQRREPWYVLRAMGLSESEADASVHFGFSELNTLEEVDTALEAIASLHATLARSSVA